MVEYDMAGWSRVRNEYTLLELSLFYAPILRVYSLYYYGVYCYLV